MKTAKQARADWEPLYVLARTAPRTSVRVNRRTFPHPRDAGARATSSWPVGQMTDHAIEGCAGEAPLTIREFNDHFEAFVDTIELGNRVVDAVEQNPKTAMLLGAALLGGAIGSSMTNKREGALVGAGIGLLVAAMVNEGSKPKRR